MKRVLKFFAWFIGCVVFALAGIVAHANYRIGKDEVDAIEMHAPGRFVTVEGRQQHFVTVGDIKADPTGAPIMVIHGFIISGHASLMPWAADQLGTQRSLVLPDLMGYGYSQRDPNPGAWSEPSSHARYLAQMLDQLGIDKVDVVGHSYGGAMTARFALDYPERVRKVVYMNPGLYAPKSRAEVVIELPMGIGRALTWHFLGNGPYSLVTGACGDTADCHWTPPARIKDTTETLRAMIYTNRHTPVLEELQADIRGVRAPGLVIWGQGDVFVASSEGERLARETRSRLEFIPNAGHLPWRHSPEVTAQKILDFLRPPP